MTPTGKHYGPQLKGCLHSEHQLYTSILLRVGDAGKGTADERPSKDTKRGEQWRNIVTQFEGLDEKIDGLNNNIKWVVKARHWRPDCRPRWLHHQRRLCTGSGNRSRNIRSPVANECPLLVRSSAPVTGPFLFAHTAERQPNALGSVQKQCFAPSSVQPSDAYPGVSRSHDKRCSGCLGVGLLLQRSQAGFARLPAKRRPADPPANSRRVLCSYPRQK